jgi:hypothetical protein
MKAQLNVRLEKSLVLRAQKAAKQQGRTLAACVAMALEQWLAAPSSAPQEPLPINRLEELEKRLERLEQQKQPLAKKAELEVTPPVGAKEGATGGDTPGSRWRGNPHSSPGRLVGPQKRRPKCSCWQSWRGCSWPCH